MVTTYQLGVNDFWDIWEALVLDHFLIVFSALQKKYYSRSESFYFLVIILQLEEIQSHAFDVGNIKIVSSYLTLEKVPKLV